jgi:DNA adenine methylase
MIKVPHVIPYQGSKRKLANDILGLINFDFNKLYEPFVGSGAVTLAAAAKGYGNEYIVGDKLKPLADLWNLIINDPEYLIVKYEKLWNGQLEDPRSFYKEVRDNFNKNKLPEDLLYLIARCVKNSVRFNAAGEFNQGADNRRLGLKPEKLMREAKAMANLLRGRTKVHAADFREIMRDTTADDLVYMDPPWQGTSTGRDNRYAFILDINELIDEMRSLNKRNVPFLLSFDGVCGDKSYGRELPPELGLTRVNLNAGRSSQATLLGRDEVTIEALYLSPCFVEKTKHGNYKNSSKTESEQYALIY